MNSTTQKHVFNRNFSMRYEFLIIILLSILPIIDSINGLTMNNNLFSIGMLYKFLLIITLMFIILNLKNIRKISIFILIFIILLLLISILVNTIFLRKEIIMEYPAKLLFNIVLAIMLIELFHKNILTGKSIGVILRNNCILLSISILTTYFLKLGFTVYSGDIGFKGFYFSQNELSAILVILFFYSIYIFVNKTNIKTLINLLSILVCAILVNTKSTLIAVSLGIIYLFIHLLKNNKLRYKLIFILFVILLMLFFRNFIIYNLSQVLKRQSGLYKIFKGDIISIVLSGRNNFLKSEFKKLINSRFFTLHFLIGNGFSHEKLIEMDFFDIFFSLGIIGIIILLIFLYFLLKSAIRNVNTKIDSGRFISLIIILLMSLFMGHVLFMATSGIYFILYCLFCIYYEDNMKINESDKYNFKQI